VYTKNKKYFLLTNPGLLAIISVTDISPYGITLAVIVDYREKG
jgi:hypothetical protein